MKEIDGKFEYFAFISYKEEDSEWAKWLQYNLEQYKLPTNIRQEKPELPERISPIYEYKSEASGGRLKEVIWRGLTSSKYLIVICSPRTTKSGWINNGIRYFVESGREEYIIPFIVEGKPKSVNPEEECFPDALLELKGDRELRGIHIDEMGQDAAVVKVVSTMLDVKFDNLWNRALKEKEEERRRLKEQNDRLLIAQSRFVAEKALDLVEEGDSYTARLLALEALPKDLENPDRPYVPETEKALRLSACKENAILRGHAGAVSFAAFSPDGKFIASTSLSDRTVKLWDARNGAILYTLSNKLDVKYNSVSFSPKGNYVYARNNHNGGCWNCKTGEFLGRISFNKVGYLPNGGLLPVVTDDKAYHDLLFQMLICDSFATFDGKLLAIPFDDKTSGEKGLQVWDAEMNTLLYRIVGEIRCAAFNYQGDKLITCDMSDRVILWDMKDGSVIQTVKAPNYSLYSTFKPDGQFVLVASTDGAIYMYSVPDLVLFRKFEGHARECYSAIFSSDGKQLVSAAKDSIVRIWESEPYKPSFSIDTHNHHCSELLKYCPDGEHIISAGINQTICMWNIKNGETIHSYRGLKRILDSSVCFSPDGKWLLSADGEKVIIWDVETEQIVHQYESENSWLVRFSPNGKQILMVGWLGSCIMDVDSWTIEETSLRDDGITAISISPDVRSFAIADGNELEIWKDYENVHPYKESDVSLDYFWQLSNGKCVSKMSKSDISCWLKYNNGEPIFQLEEGNMKRWLEHKTFFLRVTLEGHSLGINTIAFSPNNKYVVTGSDDTTIKLWNAIEMKEIKTFVGHTDEVISVEFSKDGRLILSASEDRTVRVWDVASGVELYRLLVEEEYYNLYHASFSPDNKWIATLSFGGIKIWPFPSLQDLINETRERFKNRQLTPEERKKYYLD